MAKPSKKKMLQLELAEEEAAEKFRAAKEKRKVCSECGGVKTTPKIEADIDKLRAPLHDARQKFREARSG